MEGLLVNAEEMKYESALVAGAAHLGLLDYWSNVPLSTLIMLNGMAIISSYACRPTATWIAHKSPYS